MGQYYYVVNIDKKQYLHPHRFGDGLKLLEFGDSNDGTMLALAVLLADGNGRGGGDLRVDGGHPDDALVGSWAGDRIVISGDYADRLGEQAQARPDGWAADVLSRVSAADPQALVDQGVWPDVQATVIAELGLHEYARSCFEDISLRIGGVIERSGQTQITLAPEK